MKVINMINLKKYEISDEEFEDMGFKDIVVPNPINFGLEEDIDELEGASSMYPFFAMDIESDGDSGFFDSSSFDSEDYGSDILD